MKILPFNVAVFAPCAHFRFSEHVKFAIPWQSCEVPTEGGFEIYHRVGGCCMLGRGCHYSTVVLGQIGHFPEENL